MSKTAKRSQESLTRPTRGTKKGRKSALAGSLAFILVLAFMTGLSSQRSRGGGSSRPTCPSGQHMSNGVCCPTNYWNSENLCCPNGYYNTKANNLCCVIDREYNSNGICCSKGVSYNSGGRCCLNRQENMGGLCCNKADEWNSGGKCCKKSHYNSSGKCCKKNEEWNSNNLCCKNGYSNQGGMCCKNGLVNSNGVCCQTYEVGTRGICCPRGYHSSDGRCCKIGFTFYKEEGICLGPELIPPSGQSCPADRVLTSKSICCPRNHFYAGKSICCKDGTRLDRDICCYPGEYNSSGICCLDGFYNSSGKCCQQGTVRKGDICCPEPQENKAGICCKPNQINSNNHCCEQGEHYDRGRCCPVGLFNKEGICCQENEINSKGKCCPAKHFYDQTMCCPEGTRNDQGVCCPLTKFNRSGICCHPELENRNNVCCDPSCGSCSGSAPSKCLSCPEGKKLIDGVCCNPNELLGLDGKCYLPDKCPEGSYPNSVENKCSACTNNCLKCSGPEESQCQWCSEKFENLVLKSRTCVCEDGFYMNDRKTECLKCHESCEACQGPEKTDCVSCPFDIFMIKLILNNQSSKTGRCHSCGLDSAHNFCSEYSSEPVYATDVSSTRRRSISQKITRQSLIKTGFQPFRPPGRLTYVNYLFIEYPKDTISLIKAMAEEFNLTKLYRIWMSSGSKHGDDYSIVTKIEGERSGMDVYFHFKRHVVLKKPEIEVVMDVTDKNYLSSWLKKAREEKGIESGPKARRLMEISLDDEKDLEGLVPQKLTQHTIKAKIFVQTSDQEKRENLMQFLGLLVFYLVLLYMIYRVCLLFVSFCAYNRSSLNVKSISPLMAIQFFVKLPLIDLKFNPTMLAFLDSIYALDSMRVWFLGGETWKERKRVSGKFLEYNIPALTIHSVPVSLVLLTLALILLVVCCSQRLCKGKKTGCSRLNRIGAFLTSLVGLDVVFYSLFSLVVTPFSLYYIISLAMFLLALLGIIAGVCHIWEERESIPNQKAQEDQKEKQKVIILIRKLLQPTKYTLYSIFVVLFRNEPLILIHSLIMVQIVICTVQIADVCCLQKKSTWHLIANSIKEGSMLLCFCLFRLIHQISMKSSSNHLWVLTIITAIVFIISLILNIVGHEVEDWVFYLNQPKKHKNNKVHLFKESKKRTKGYRKKYAQQKQGLKGADYSQNRPKNSSTGDICDKRISSEGNKIESISPQQNNKRSEDYKEQGHGEISGQYKSPNTLNSENPEFGNRHTLNKREGFNSVRGYSSKVNHYPTQQKPCSTTRELFIKGCD